MTNQAANALAEHARERTLSGSNRFLPVRLVVVAMPTASRATS